MFDVPDILLFIGAAVAFILLMKYLPWEKARSGSGADAPRAPYGFSPAGMRQDEDEDILTPGFVSKEDINPATGLPMVGGIGGRDLAGKRYGEL